MQYTYTLRYLFNYNSADSLNGRTAKERLLVSNVQLNNYLHLGCKNGLSEYDIHCLGFGRIIKKRATNSGGN